MQMYDDYLKEREGKNRGCIENEYGWASYLITNDECYITDIYVKPEYRKAGWAMKIADKVVEMAKKIGCTYIIGTVLTDATVDDFDKDLDNRTRSVKVLLGYGMRLLRCDKDKAVFHKEI